MTEDDITKGIEAAQAQMDDENPSRRLWLEEEGVTTTKRKRRDSDQSFEQSNRARFGYGWDHVRTAYRSHDFAQCSTVTHQTHRFAGCGEGIEAYVGVDEGNCDNCGDQAIVSFSGGQGFQVQARERNDGGLGFVDLLAVGGGVEIPDLADALEWAGQELRRRHAETIERNRARHTA